MPNIVSLADYYPFGMEMPGRTYTSETYKYGYQGSEKDAEYMGGNAYTTYYRGLDPRLGRWFSPDPKTFPWQSPYCSMDNNPIALVDPFGAATIAEDPPKSGGPMYQGTDEPDIVDYGAPPSRDPYGKINPMKYAFSQGAQRAADGALKTSANYMIKIGNHSTYENTGYANRLGSNGKVYRVKWSEKTGRYGHKGGRGWTTKGSKAFPIQRFAPRFTKVAIRGMFIKEFRNAALWMADITYSAYQDRVPDLGTGIAFDNWDKNNVEDFIETSEIELSNVIKEGFDDTRDLINNNNDYTGYKWIQTSQSVVDQVFEGNITNSHELYMSTFASDKPKIYKVLYYEDEGGNFHLRARFKMKEEYDMFGH